MPKGSRKRSAEEAVGDVEDALAGTDEENSIVGVKAEDEDGLEASQGDQLSGEQVQSAASDEESGDDKEEEEEEEASKDEKESGNLDQEDEAMENVAEAEDDAADDQNENQEGSPETKFRKINIAGR